MSDDDEADLVNQAFPVPMRAMPRGMQLARESTERELGIRPPKQRWWQRLLHRPKRHR